MRCLIEPGSLERAARTLVSLEPRHVGKKQPANVVVLSGFPCLVRETPPTETDGPAGSLAIARAAVSLGYTVTLATDRCNEAVFAAACTDAGTWASSEALSMDVYPPV